MGCTSTFLNRITVKQCLSADQCVYFHGVDGPLTAGKITIIRGGNLRNVLQNYWCNDWDGGFFSLLCTAQALYIRDYNSLVDLVDYVNGRYQLGEHWGHE